MEGVLGLLDGLALRLRRRLGVRLGLSFLGLVSLGHGLRVGLGLRLLRLGLHVGLGHGLGVSFGLGLGLNRLCVGLGLRILVGPALHLVRLDGLVVGLCLLRLRQRLVSVLALRLLAGLFRLVRKVSLGLALRVVGVLLLRLVVRRRLVVRPVGRLCLVVARLLLLVRGLMGLLLTRVLYVGNETLIRGRRYYDHFSKKMSIPHSPLYPSTLYDTVFFLPSGRST